ncbi:MAG: hypothetical protein NXI24_25160, partial [bacterium]|nr:hypothetical protein [bacterium]
AYGYFTPKYSQLYLNEYSALKALRLHGIDTILSLVKSVPVGNVDPKYSGSLSETASRPQVSYLRRKLAENLYFPPELHERKGIDHSDSRRQIRGKLRYMLAGNDLFAAKQAHVDYLNTFNSLPRYRKQNEKKYNAAAHALWNRLHRFDSKLSTRLADETRVGHRLTLRIIRKWAALKLVSAEEIRATGENRIKYRVTRIEPLLPDFLYTWDREEFENQPDEHENVVVRNQRPRRRNKHGISKNERTKYIQEMYK